MNEIEKKLDEILAEYFTWHGEAIHEINQTTNYKRLKSALTSLIVEERIVNRLEVIDHTEGFEERGGARAYMKWNKQPFKVELSDQDEGRTLKIFLSDVALTNERENTK